MILDKKMNAYTGCPRSAVEEEGGKLIDLRWIDTSKGDWGGPNYRPRLVGRSLSTSKDDSLYSATPPIEARRIRVSHDAIINGGGRTTRGYNGDRRRELMISDVNRAYFYAPATRGVFIELPTEDEEAKEG